MPSYKSFQGTQTELSIRGGKGRYVLTYKFSVYIFRELEEVGPGRAWLGEWRI